MRYGLKIVYPGWRVDSLRGERIAFPARAPVVNAILTGTQFLVYVTGEGIVGAGEITGTVPDAVSRYGVGSGPFPVCLPMRLILELPVGDAVPLTSVGLRPFQLARQTWIPLTKKHFEHGLEEARERVDALTPTLRT